jgi:hypothetical protein
MNTAQHSPAESQMVLDLGQEPEPEARDLIWERLPPRSQQVLMDTYRLFPHLRPAIKNRLGVQPRR